MKTRPSLTSRLTGLTVGAGLLLAASGAFAEKVNLIDGSPKNSVTAVPVPSTQPIPLTR